jgi:phosphatidylglycerol:prolipoprotein diacylglycerol transferase
MCPVLLEIFGIKIYSYGLLMAVGILCAVTVSAHLAKRSLASAEPVYDLSFVIVLCSLLGARIFYVLNNAGYFLAHPVEIFLLNRGGLVFFGGLIAGFAGAYVYLKKTGQNVWQTGDIVMAGVPLGQAFGRIGCFLNGCCFGRPTDLDIGIAFPPGSFAVDHYQDLVTVHPVQLYNAGADFLVFLVLYTVFEERRFSGQIVALYGLLSSLVRFLTEFFRGDVPLVGPFTQAQWISIAVFLFSVVLYRRLASRSRAAEQEKVPPPA